MNWTKLIIGTVVIYLAYYVVIIAMDLFKNKNEKSSAGYEVIDMDYDDEIPETIDIEEPFDNVEINERNVENIDLGVVETQGIPVDEFVKRAREMSSNIEF